MPFVKLDCGMLTSTLWTVDPDRIVFVTALLMAEPMEYTDPLPQLEVRTLEETGWCAPPGWYGFVAAAGVGILRMAGIEQEPGLAALERLGSPETDSRSREYDGRRLIRINGGYLVLNFQKYRDHDYTAAERAARYRKRKNADRERDGRDVTGDNRDAVTKSCDVTRNITQAEAEAEADSREKKNTPGESTRGGNSAPAGAPAVPPAPPRASPGDLLRIWNENRGPLAEAKGMSLKRKAAAQARLRDVADPQRWAAAVRRLAASSFATGASEGGWRATIDFLLRPDSLLKIEEGKYDDREPVPRKKSGLQEGTPFIPNFKEPPPGEPDPIATPEEIRKIREMVRGGSGLKGMP